MIVLGARILAANLSVSSTVRAGNVILGAVRNVAVEVLENILSRGCVVVHFTLNKMIFCALIGESFGKRAASSLASRAGLPKSTGENKLEHRLRK